MNANKFFSIVAVVLIGILTGCSLDTEPRGSTVSKDQYEKNMFSAEAHIRGLYRIMIAATDNDEFGQKSIDIKTDIISGDMALTNVLYGWFQDCDQLQASHRGSGFSYYIWSYYYRIIKNCNLIISAKGDADLANPETPEEIIKANFIGQAYAMRGLAYYSLSYYYSRNQEAIKVYPNNSNILINPCVPVYDENTSDVEAQPLATLEQVLNQAEGDLLLAVNYLKNYDRESLTLVNKDVAKTILAYLYIYRGRLFDRIGDASLRDDDAKAALDLCNEVIATGNYPIIPLKEVTTTGFNNISSRNWMWGQDITAETSSSLWTFWGAMDIYTYSYAWAGDVKAIDATLYADFKAAHPKDERVKWWTTTNDLAPTGKFYDSGRKKGGDRMWLNDIVFMRSEELYLIAAESAFLMRDYTTAKNHLKTLVEQRDPEFAENLPEDSSIGDEIYLNWRIEMWGEGKAYFTMQRFDKSRKRGDNHYYLAGNEVSAYDGNVCFEIPSTEIKYNPHLHE